VAVSLPAHHPLGKIMTTQVAIVEEYGKNSAKRVVIHDTDILNFEARLATNLIEKWGMVACTDAGEDSTGRWKMTELTPIQVVERACDIAALTAMAFHDRGWLVKGPDISEILRKTDD
jgi:hypothetical protein